MEKLGTGKKVLRGFLRGLAFCFLWAHSSPFLEPRGRIGLPLWGRRGLVSGLSQFLPSPPLGPPGDLVVCGQVIGVQGAAWANKY